LDANALSRRVLADFSRRHRTNRKHFDSLLSGVDHLPHTYNREEQAFTKGEPEWGAHLADDLNAS
jgi:hypothetical protein